MNSVMRLRYAMHSSLMGLSVATLLGAAVLWPSTAQADDLPPVTRPFAACDATVFGGTCPGAGSGGGCPATTLKCNDIAKDSCLNSEGVKCQCGVASNDDAKCACQ